MQNRCKWTKDGRADGTPQYTMPLAAYCWWRRHNSSSVSWRIWLASLQSALIKSNQNLSSKWKAK